LALRYGRRSAANAGAGVAQAELGRQVRSQAQLGNEEDNLQVSCGLMNDFMAWSGFFNRRPKTEDRKPANQRLC